MIRRGNAGEQSPQGTLPGFPFWAPFRIADPDRIGPRIIALPPDVVRPNRHRRVRRNAASYTDGHLIQPWTGMNISEPQHFHLPPFQFCTLRVFGKAYDYGILLSEAVSDHVLG